MNANQPSPEGFSGSIDQIQLTDLIQSFCLAQTDQGFKVESGQSSGVIYVQSGQVVHGEIGFVNGEEAFYEMFRWQRGQFETMPIPKDAQATISKPWEYLLIEAIRRRGTQTSSDTQVFHGLIGTIEGIQLVDLIQLLCLARTDHQIGLRSDQGSGRIHLRSGQVYHAEVDEARGEDAFFEMTQWKGGEFNCLQGLAEDVVSIEKPWEYLLIEAMRTLDEKSEVDEEENARAESLFQKVQRMRMVEKIRLAMIGDKEARSLLIRDANRMIQSALINNPRITEGEVASIARSRSTYEEVLRRIANNREWLNVYSIKLALVNNPKTPVQISTRLVSSLVARDVKNLAKSKAVPNAVAQVARRISAHRE